MSAYDTLILGEAGLLRYYPLNDAAGSTTAVDLKSSQNGTVSGAVTFGTASLLGPDAETAATFSGGNISLPLTGLPTGASPWSFEIWFRSSNAAAQYVLMSMGSATNNQGIGFEQVSNGFGAFIWGITQSGPFSSSNTIDHFHVVTTYDGTTLITYVNGVQVGSSSPFTINLTQTVAYIGAAPNGGFLTSGVLQKAAIYNVVLTAAQVSNHYSSGAPTANPAISNAYVEAATISSGSPTALSAAYIEAATTVSAVPAALSSAYVEAGTIPSATPAALSVAYIEILSQTAPPPFEGWGVSI